MIIFAVCDDQRYMVEKMKGSIERYVQERFLSARVLTFADGEHLLDSGERPDVVLLDMKLPGMDGMEAARGLRRAGGNSQIIFITAYGEYVYQAFDVDAVHYLLKPVREEQLFPALDKAVMRAANKDGRTVTVSRGGSVHVIPLCDVIYCEAMDHRITIHMRTGRYECGGTLDALFGQLDERFFRCHRSYIVNLNYVMSSEKDLVTMVGGDRILVSRRRRQEFMKRLLSFFRNEVM